MRTHILLSPKNTRAFALRTLDATGSWVGEVVGQPIIRNDGVTCSIQVNHPVLLSVGFSGRSRTFLQTSCASTLDDLFYELAII
jgi:hypothetical protein